MKRATDGLAEELPRVAKVLRPEVLAMSGYHVADAAGMVKLDAMENPYFLPDALRAELGAIAASAPLNRYPDSEAPQLKAALRAAFQVPQGMELLLGNGSDELIQLLTLACARPAAKVLGVEPSFAMYPIVARSCGVEFVAVSLTKTFALDASALTEAIARYRPALVFLAYPNNPTGNLFDREVLDQVLQLAPGLVVIDEAYHPFAQSSYLPRLAEHPNLLVMRTLSKLGLAGLRLGVLIGAPCWIRELNKVRLPYNVNVLTQLVAEHMLTNAAVLEAQAAAIRRSRGELLAGLSQVPGVEAFASDANFLLFRIPAANRVFEALKGKGILIKNLTGVHPLLADCLRVTVGTPDENAVFLDVLHNTSHP
jgi:histidinol-phosphate aminotransferase